MAGNVEPHTLRTAYAVIGALTDLLEEFAGDARDPLVEAMRTLGRKLAEAVPAELDKEAVQRREFTVALRQRVSSRRAT